MKQRAAAIIVAAGSAQRFGTAKILTPIAGSTAVERAVRAFAESDRVDEIVLVTCNELLDDLRHRFGARADIRIVEGGSERQHSVSNGLAALGDVDIVLVHDAARPLVTSDVIARVLDGLSDRYDACIPVLPVADTLKRVQADQIATVDRTGLFRAQTPQAFRVERLRAALSWAAEHGKTATDEAGLIEETGGTIATVPGDERLMKLTYPEDAAVLNQLAQEPRRYQTGIGYDAHRLVPERPLILGGVQFDFHLGLDGHSDADVLAHAVADAVLGAAALGDIGQHFPPSDPQWRGMDSTRILARAVELLASVGAALISIDATVIAEAPKIGPAIPQMQQKLSQALGIATDRISIKATTNELMGFVGRGEGIAALATATISLPGS